MNQLEVGGQGERGGMDKGGGGRTSNVASRRLLPDPVLGFHTHAPSWRMVDEESGKEVSNFFTPPSSCFSDLFSRPDPDQTQKQLLHLQATRVHPWACSRLPSSPKEEASGYRWGAGLCGSGLR